MNAGALAFAHTRVCAARGRLIDGQMLLRLRLADTPAARAAALSELGLGDGTALDAVRVLIARLARDYHRILRGIPGDPAPFEALRGRHEIENLKLVWRALVRGHPTWRWTPWWRAIGVLELDDFRSVRSAGEMAEAAGPYRAVVERLPNAGARAELALDAFASERIAEAAKASEPDLAKILNALVAEREAALDRRAEPELRRRLCARAFLRGPLSRAPAAALLLREEDIIGEVIARAEAV